MSDAKINGTAVGVISVGFVFLYAGIKGYSIPQTIQSVVQGKTPAKQTQVTAIDTPNASSSTSGGGGGGFQTTGVSNTGVHSCV
jgi:hypothetical protein